MTEAGDGFRKRRKAAIRTAIGLGILALGIYIGFFFLKGSG